MAKEAVAFLEQHQNEPFFLNYWMFSVHAPFDAKQSLIDEYRKITDPNDPQRSPTYAAMIESMDDAVGTLLDTLDRLKIADNTIIIFLSDNGASHERDRRAFKNYKPTGDEKMGSVMATAWSMVMPIEIVGVISDGWSTIFFRYVVRATRSANRMWSRT